MSQSPEPTVIGITITHRIQDFNDFERAINEMNTFVEEMEALGCKVTFSINSAVYETPELETQEAEKVQP